MQFLTRPLYRLFVRYLYLMTGYFQIEGCDGVNPTLHLTVGKTYKFDQSDITNWYHLVGFAYEADGAHVPVDELEPGMFLRACVFLCFSFATIVRSTYFFLFHHRYCSSRNELDLR